MKKVARPIVIILVLLLASYYGYRYYAGSKSTTLQASGTIEATTIELNTRNSGTIYRLPVEEGQFIKAGQLVAELSREDLLAQREKAAMTLKFYEAQLKDLQSGARSQEIAELAMRVVGEPIVGRTDIGGVDGVDTTEIVREYLWSLQYTIAAGTSQIQRNLIAERILGLPKGR